MPACLLRNCWVSSMLLVDTTRELFRSALPLSLRNHLSSFIRFRKIATGKKLITTIKTPKFGPFKMILEHNKTPEGFFFFFKVLVDNNRLFSKSHTHSPKNDGKSDFSLDPSYLQTFPMLRVVCPFSLPHHVQ